MEIKESYVVYELNRILGSDKHLALEKVEFKGMTCNGFDTERAAIQAIFDDELQYTDYVILKQVYLR